MNSFIYKVSILIFYTVELNTDFANIKNKLNICEVSIHFNCIKYKNSFAKSVYTDDSEVILANLLHTCNLAANFCIINILFKYIINSLYIFTYLINARSAMCFFGFLNSE